MLGAHEKPDVTYADVGGLDMQKQEIREAVELPLTHFDLYKQIGMLLQSTLSELRNLFVLRNRSATRSLTLWSTRDRKDHACKGCRQQYHSQLYTGGRIRVCAEIPW